MSDGERAVENYLRNQHFHISKMSYFKNSNSADNWLRPDNYNKVIIGYKNPNWLLAQDQSLHLDFYLKYEGQYIAIEYDGCQHFGYSQHFDNNDISNYEQRREYDRKKDMLCSLHRIHLIRLLDVGSLISANPIKARRIIKEDLEQSLSNILELQQSYIYGTIRKWVSWNDSYQINTRNNNIMKECTNCANKLKDYAGILIKYINILNYTFSQHSYYIPFNSFKKFYAPLPRINTYKKMPTSFFNRIIAKRVEIVSLLLDSVISDIGVIKPSLNNILIQMRNDIMMGLLQFYTHPSNIHLSENLQDEQDTCKIIILFAKGVLNEFK